VGTLGVESMFDFRLHVQEHQQAVQELSALYEGSKVVESSQKWLKVA
jgi:hypothetical protein